MEEGEMLRVLLQEEKKTLIRKASYKDEIFENASTRRKSGVKISAFKTIVNDVGTIVSVNQ
jgi:hypothetical protein